MALNDLGKLPLGTVIPLHWSSHDAATGANEALSGLATSDIEIYKGTSMTQRSSDAGYALLDTDGIDIDGMVGANGISIDTGDNTDAGFFVAGSFYNVWVGPVTIDGQTVNIHLATFYLEATPPTAAEITAAILAMVYEDAETFQEYLRLSRAALYGLSSGAATTNIKFLGEDETTERIDATVDADGNRTALTLDPS